MSPSKTITILAPAKINLCLAVLGQRADGYHEIASLMQMVGHYDRLTFHLRPSGIRLTMGDENLPAGRDNLVFQAASLLRKEARRSGQTVGGAAIFLKKNIPIAAGLGGGSADAAATLSGLNRLWGLKWPRERLARLGAVLGSDVPFFFHGPTAWATGRGEQVHRIASFLAGWVVLVDPEIPISTAWAYEQYARRFADITPTPRPKGPSNRRAVPDRAAIARFAREPRNDLEKVTLSAWPQLVRIKNALRRRGGAWTLMSGSGASLFSLFLQKDQALRAASTLREKGMGRVWVVRVLRRAPF